MSALLYANGNHEIPELHPKNTESQAACHYLEVYDDLNAFSKRLRQLPRMIDVAVLIAFSNDQLSAFMALGSLLEDIDIILILPNRDKKTIQDGFRLLPRFIGYIDEDIANIGTVLERILSKSFRTSRIKRGAPEVSLQIARSPFKSSVGETDSQKDSK